MFWNTQVTTSTFLFPWIWFWKLFFDQLRSFTSIPLLGCYLFIMKEDIQHIQRFQNELSYAFTFFSRMFNQMSEFWWIVRFETWERWQLVMPTWLHHRHLHWIQGMSTLHRVKASHEISNKIGTKQRNLAWPLHKVRPSHQGLALLGVKH